MLSLSCEETRKSLKSVFENIFSKYDREFDEDDEVDLLDMKVIKPGGHLARLTRQNFGNVFKKKKLVNKESLEVVDELGDEIGTLEVDEAQIMSPSDPLEQAKENANIALNSAKQTPKKHLVFTPIKKHLSKTTNKNRKLSDKIIEKNHIKNGILLNKASIEQLQFSFDEIIKSILHNEFSDCRVVEHTNGCFDCKVWKLIQKAMFYPPN